MKKARMCRSSKGERTHIVVVGCKGKLLCLAIEFKRKTFTLRIEKMFLRRVEGSALYARLNMVRIPILANRPKALTVLAAGQPPRRPGNIPLSHLGREAGGICEESNEHYQPTKSYPENKRLVDSATNSEVKRSRAQRSKLRITNRLHLINPIILLNNIQIRRSLPIISTSTAGATVPSRSKRPI